MRKILLLLISFICIECSVNKVYAQSYSPVWVNDISGGGGSVVTAEGLDKAGNVYITGRFAGTAIFNLKQGGSQKLISNGAADIFIAKYDPVAGNYIWAIGFGGTSDEHTTSLAIDNNDNVLVTGQYQSSSINFNPKGNYSLSPVGAEDVFFAKYDSNGNFIWAKSIGESGTDRGAAITTDNNNNVFIQGIFQNTMNADPNTGNSPLVSNNGGYQQFVGKYDPNGNLVWAHVLPGGFGQSTDQPIKVDSNTGDVVIGGAINQSFDFSYNGTAGATINPAQSSNFIAKYSNDGTYQWVKYLQVQSGSANCSSILINAQSDIFLDASFSGIFYPDGPTGASITSKGSTDLSISRYSSTGTLKWDDQLGGSGASTYGNNMGFDNNQNLVVAGSFNGSINFNPAGNGIMSSAGGGEYFFISSYDLNGLSLAHSAFGGTCGSNVIYQVTANASGTYIGGGFCGAVNFDPSTCSTDILTASATPDALVAKYVLVPASSSVNTITAPAVTSFCGSGDAASISGSALTGNVTYQWQSSTDGTNYVNITGATAQNYDPPLSTVTTYYRRQAVSASCTISLNSNPVEIIILPQPASPVIPTQAICSGSQATLAVSQPQGGITYNWYDDITGGTLLGTGVQYTTTALTATTTFYTEADNANGCSSARTATIVTVSQPPQAPASFTQNICTGGTATLTLADAQAGSTYNWYDSAAKTNLLFTGTSYTTGAINANTTYYVEATNASCPPSALASINVIAVPIPTAPVVANNPQAICSSTTDVVLNVTNPQAGLTYNWYSSATSITALATGSSYDAATINPTNNYYVDATNSTGCVSPRTAVTITVNTPPGLTTYNAFICPGDATATVKATTDDANSTIRWYADAAGNTFLASGGSLTVPANINAVYYATGTDNNSGCTSILEPALIKQYAQLAAPVVTVGTITSTSITFNWGTVQDATGYQVSIDNGQTFAAPSSGSTGLSHTITGLQPGEKVTIVVQALGSSTCQLSTSSSAITAIVQYPQQDLIYVANAFTPNGDGNNDVVYVHSQSIKSMAFYIYDQWGEMLFESTSQAVGWDGTYKGKQQPVGVYVYFVKAVMNDGQQLTKKGTITLLK